MSCIEVFHVVTERPMQPGQVILFDEQHHNGVYARVRAFERIESGETVNGPLYDMLRADMDRWGKVARRELALERVRVAEFPGCPSRMSCLYTSRELADARGWADFFRELGRDVYSLVRLSVRGRAFTGDACNCFDGTLDEVANTASARRYWRAEATDKSIYETIVDGEITVAEIIEQYR